MIVLGSCLTKPGSAQVAASVRSATFGGRLPLIQPDHPTPKERLLRITRPMSNEAVQPFLRLHL